ncbi:MAG: hypothetical protein ACRD01_16435 [Terriglobales bacterium]
MPLIYVITLLACALAIVVLIGWRLLHVASRPLPRPGRLINEWIWTLLPLAVVAALIWRALA